MFMIWTKRILVIALLLLVGQPATTVFGVEEAASYNFYRAKLLSYLLRKDLSLHHYSHKPINDELSKAAFDIYLKISLGLRNCY